MGVNGIDSVGLGLASLQELRFVELGFEALRVAQPQDENRRGSNADLSTTRTVECRRSQ